MSYHRALGMPLRTGSVIGMNHLDYVRDAYAPPLSRCTEHELLPPRLALAWQRAVARRRAAGLMGESGDGLGGILAVL